jgi:hypothetical protein
MKKDTRSKPSSSKDKMPSAKVKPAKVEAKAKSSFPSTGVESKKKEAKAIAKYAKQGC